MQVKIWSQQFEEYGTLVVTGEHPTDHCHQSQDKETVKHILISCRKYEEERRAVVTCGYEWTPGLKRCLSLGAKLIVRFLRTTTGILTYRHDLSFDLQ